VLKLASPVTDAELPKAVPGEVTDPKSHDRIRHDIVDKAGSVTLRYGSRLHHIGLGRTHAGTCVIMLVQDLQSGSSTPPPANSSSTTSPPAHPKDPPNRRPT
jgi:hypothetical protein